MNSHRDYFDRFNENIKQNDKHLKKDIIWHGVLICVLVAMKNDKLDFSQNLQRKSSQKGLSSINI